MVSEGTEVLAALVPGERSRWPGANLTCNYSLGDALSSVHREPDETAVLNH